MQSEDGTLEDDIEALSCYADIDLSIPKNAVVLEAFPVLDKGRRANPRAYAEWGKRAGLSSKCRDAAHARWWQGENKGGGGGMRTHSGRICYPQSQSQSQLQSESQPEKRRLQASEVKVSKLMKQREYILSRYNEIALRHKLRRITAKLSASRMRNLNARISDYPKRSHWDELFAALDKSADILAKEPWFGFDYIIRNGETWEKVRSGWMEWKRGKGGSDQRGGRLSHERDGAALKRVQLKCAIRCAISTGSSTEKSECDCRHQSSVQSIS
jgi:hypothetical protein